MKTVRLRPPLAAAISVMAAGAMVIPTSVPAPAAAPYVITHAAPRVELAASVRSLLLDPPNAREFADAKAAISRLDPSVAEAAEAAPAPLNAASDAITAAYQFIQYWVDYGVQLTNYVLGFVPGGYLIASQVNIIYYNLVRPISDSVVYGLINPVVNDPLNPASYVNGLITVGQTSINALINTGIQEFNYFFGWLIPPLPPLPLAATESSVPETTQLAATSSADSEVAPEEATAQVTPSAQRHAMAATVEPAETDVVDTTVDEAAGKVAENTETAPTASTPETAPIVVTPVDTLPTKTTPTTTSAGGVQAQGEVRGGSQETTDPASKNPIPDDKTPDDKSPADTTPTEKVTTVTEPAEPTKATEPAAPAKATESTEKASDGPDKSAKAGGDE